MQATRVAFTALLFAPVMIIGLTSALLAFIFPLELELREGTSWLYALSAQAHVSIYDQEKVAFLNMNHGPIDPMIKGLVLQVLPFLTAGMATRVFVLGLPIVFLFAAVTNIEGRRSISLGLGAMMYVFIIGLQPPFYLVGRSDPCAMFFLALVLVVRSTRFIPSLRPDARSFIAALLGWAVLLSNWRFFPAAAGLEAAFILEGSIALDRRSRYWYCVRQCAIFVAVGLVVLGALVIVLFHGNVGDYYRRFFGFFSAESGWGAVSEGSLSLAPANLLSSRWLVHIAALSAIVAVWFFPSPRVPRYFQCWIWLPMLVSLWVATCAGYFLNHAGGGLYYFAPFYVILAFHVARSGDWARLSGSAIPSLILIPFYLGLPWVPTTTQITNLERSMRPAFDFVAKARKLTNGSPIYSEDFHFLKTRYGGEVVDMGDVVAKVSATGYFGPTLTDTVNRHFEQLKANPPQFVITGGLGSPTLKELIASKYVTVLRAPPHLWPYTGPPATLMKYQP